MSGVPHHTTLHTISWIVVYDFMSFCTNLYGKNFEDSEISIADSRIQLISDIHEYPASEFQYSKLQHVFLSIARSANGILVDTFVPKMINDHEIDSEDENDLNNDIMIAMKKNQNLLYKRDHAIECQIIVNPNRIHRP